MKPGKIIIFVILFVLGLTGCGTEENEPIIKDEEENYDETELITTINIDGIDATEFYKGCLLTSIHEETPIGNGSLRIKSEINDKIQTYLISDANNKIYMMSRVPNTQLNKEIVVDIASTTFALITLHPLFSSMTIDEFASMESLVTSNRYYQTLKNEVEKVVKEKKDIYDTTNSALISALDNLINDIFLNADLPIDSITSKDVSRAVYNHSQIDASFIEAKINENILTLSTKWWTPSYFGTVEQPDGTIENQAILARDDFGAMDLLFNRTICGPPMEYKFKEAGKYHFSFSRINPLAQLDFFQRITSNILSAIGLSIDYDYLKIEAKYLLEAYEELGGSLSDGNMSALEFLGIAHNALITQLTEDTEDVVKIFGITRTDKMKAFFEMYSNKICVWYNTAKVAGNFTGRLTGALAAPTTVEFTHNYEGISLNIIEGNEQIGLKNKKLDIPLVVEIADMDSVYSYEYNYKVLFEVVEGGGKIQSEHVFLDLEHITFNGFKAETEWTLGAEGEQKIRATVIDVITGDKVSSPVYFTADLTNLSLKKVTGDNQQGFSNKYLEDVLGVQIEMDKKYLSPLYKYYDIKYEVVSGSGELSETIKSPDSNNYAKTQWKLGEEGEQKVKVTLVDKETKEIVCEPVYFTASFHNVFLEKVSGDNQIGMSNMLLGDPLVVRIACTDTSISLNDKYYVDYEIVSGDGQIEPAYYGDPNCYAAKWILGSTGKQTSKATLIEKGTWEIVGEPVYFTATVNDDIINEKEALITLYNSTHNHSWQPDMPLEDLLWNVILSDDGYVSWINLERKQGGDAIIEGFSRLEGIHIPDDHGYNSITFRDCNISCDPDIYSPQFWIHEWADGLNELNFERVKIEDSIEFSEIHRKFMVNNLNIINSEMGDLFTGEMDINNVTVIGSRLKWLWIGTNHEGARTGNYKNIKIEQSSFESLYFMNMVADNLSITNCKLLENSSVRLNSCAIKNVQIKDFHQTVDIDHESIIEQLVVDNCTDYMKVNETCSVYDMTIQNTSNKFYCVLAPNTVERLSYINCERTVKNMSFTCKKAKSYLYLENCVGLDLPSEELDDLYVTIINSFNPFGDYIENLTGYLTVYFIYNYHHPK